MKTGPDGLTALERVSASCLKAAEAIQREEQKDREREEKMNQNEITARLDQLATLRLKLDETSRAHQNRVSIIIPPDIQEHLQRAEEEYRVEMEPLAAQVSELESKIKGDVLEVGATVKGAALMAVYSKGRVTWDAKALDGYATAHPEIEPFRKEGAPSVSIR